MPESFRTTIAQFSTAGGRWQSRAANVRAVEPAPELLAAKRGNLYILVEVHGTGGGHPALYRQMLNAAQTAFYEMGETVEAALRQAVRSAHMVLRRANEGLPEAGWTGGISLVVHYANQLIIGQAGPSLVMVSHPKTVDQFPAEPGKWGPPLGTEARPEIQIYDTTIEEDSVVLIAQSDWSEHVSPEALAVAAATPDLALATGYLGQLAGTADLSALLIGFTRDIPELRPGEEKPLFPPEPQPAAPEEAPTVRAEPAERKSLLTGMGRLFAREQPDSQAAPSPAEPAQAGIDRPAEPAAAAPSTELSAEELTPTRQPGAPSGKAAWPEPTPISEPEPEPTPQPRATRNPWWLLLALVIIPLLIAAIVLAMLFGRNSAVEAQFVEKLDGAINVLTQVEGISDEATALQRLGQARDFLDQARGLRPDDERLAPVEARYEELLARLQHVTFLYGSVPLWNFERENRSWRRVLVSGDALFVHDGNRSEVYRFTRSTLGDTVIPVETPVIRKGDQIDSLIVGDLVDIAWVEASGANRRSKLLAVDRSGGLIGYDVTWGPERLNLAGREKWVRPELVAGYGGNLYIADVGAGQIWRHRPAETGYGEAEPYFGNTTVNLAGLQAMAIDGNIWLLFADGRLLKFFGGEQRSFIWRRLPQPLNGPADIAVPLQGDRLYVADAGNGRIIEATKDGEFLRQFRMRQGDILRNLRSLFLDEAGAMFYILTDDQLYRVDIPAAGATQRSN
ncbi:MAG: hypothetical protein ACUVR4_10220 [Anaerolineae bacterium]